MTQRPMFLSLLCIASLVYNGLLILILIAAFFFRNYLTEVIRNYANAKSPEVSLYVFLFSGLLLAGMAFFGVLKMWQLKKVGFLLFLITNMLIMIALYFFFTLSLWHLILSILMLFIFWIYAKRMK